MFRLHIFALPAVLPGVNLQNYPPSDRRVARTRGTGNVMQWQRLCARWARAAAGWDGLYGDIWLLDPGPAESIDPHPCPWATFPQRLHMHSFRLTHVPAKLSCQSISHMAPIQLVLFFANIIHYPALAWRYKSITFQVWSFNCMKSLQRVRLAQVIWQYISCETEFIWNKAWDQKLNLIRNISQKVIFWAE
jgi:hypothetical protein